MRRALDYILAPPTQGVQKTRRRAAFSLFEVAMVLAIIGVLAAIAAPRYANSINHYRVDLAARRMAADIAAAQIAARTRSSTTSVIFDAAAHAYEVIGVKNPYQHTQPFIVKLAAEPYRAMVKDVNFAGGSQLHFNGFGTPHAAGAVTIVAGRAQRTITVQLDSGAATIQ